MLRSLKRCSVKRLLAVIAMAALALVPLLASAQVETAAPHPPAAAKPAPQLDTPMFPLEQLKPGQKGTGYTVIRGTEIKPFNVEILELVPKGGFDGGPMVLARFSGETIEFSNGIAGGYSGSPVYIDGKLLGAVSHGDPVQRHAYRRHHPDPKHAGRATGWRGR